MTGIYFWSRSKTLLELYRDLKSYGQYGHNQLSAGQIDLVRRLLKKFYAPVDNTSTLVLLREALFKYGSALDDTEWRLSFLLLWQVLELITLQTAQSTNMKEVINRISGFLDNDQTIRDLLYAIYETRNKLVHQGNFPDENGLDEVKLLKNVVEKCITRLFAR